MEGLTDETKFAKKYESFGSIKAYGVDTLGRIMFYVPAVGLWEAYGADMEPNKILTSRATATLLNFGLGRAHGKVREIVSYVTKTTDESPAYRKFLADTLSAISLSIGAYSISLHAAGATKDESMLAIPFSIGFVLGTGRIFGKYMDWWRKKAGTTPVYEK